MRATPALFAAALMAAAASVPVFADHCATTAPTVTPIPGEPGAYLVETPRGPRVARAQATPTRAAGGVVVVRVLNFAFDVDNNPVGTPHDIVEIPEGTTVRWELGSGFHTVTSGEGSADPNAGAFFDATLFDMAPVFEMTFNDPGTIPYFCGFHELQNMTGTIVVTKVASTPNPGAIVRTGFSRPPAPNPTRRDVSFAVAMVTRGEAGIDILDAAGRRVSSVHRGTLEAGEHAFRWDGRAGGRPAAPGVYLVRLRAGATVETRAFSMLR